MRPWVALCLILISASQPSDAGRLPRNALIVSLGDSITAGYKATIRYPELLARNLDVRVINLAIGGLTAKDASYLKMPPLPTHCSIATIYLGGNDAANIYYRKTETLLEYAKAMRIVIAEAKASCDYIYVATIPNYGQPILMRGLNNVIRGLGTFVVDLNADARMDDARNYSDGIHPNDLGQRVIAEDFKAAIRRWTP